MRSIWFRFQLKFPRMMVLLFLAAAITPSQVAAHPHEFVTMLVQAKFDVGKKMSGLTYTWLFDEIFTAYAVEGQDSNKNGQAEQEELDALLLEILGNIEEIDYFTGFDENGTVPKFAAARPLHSKMIDGRVEISFHIPFQEVIDVSTKPFRFAIYDDEFYIAMNHDLTKKDQILPPDMAHCEVDIQLPNPDEDLVAYANSLGKQDSAGYSLGESFAEWVSIACP